VSRHGPVPRCGDSGEPGNDSTSHLILSFDLPVGLLALIISRIAVPASELPSGPTGTELAVCSCAGIRLAPFEPFPRKGKPPLP